MSNGEDEARVTAIRERAARATEGPWKAEPEGDGRCNGIHPDRHNHDPAIPCWDADTFDCPAQQEIVTTDSGVYGPKWPDAEFIAHAREDIPFLLALLSTRTQERDEARTALDHLVGECACVPVSSRICERGTPTCTAYHYRFASDVHTKAVQQQLAAAQQARAALVENLERLGRIAAAATDPGDRVISLRVLEAVLAADRARPEEETTVQKGSPDGDDR